MKAALKTTILLGLFFTLLLAQFNIVFARSPEEIAAELEQKQKELAALSQQLKAAESELNASTKNKNSSQSELQRAKAEINEIDYQLQVNKIKQEQMEGEISIKDLEKEQIEEDQNIQITTAYLNWKTNSNETVKLLIESNNTESGFLKKALYEQVISEKIYDQIITIQKELDTLNSQNDEYLNLIKDLESDAEALKDRVVFLENQIKAAEEAIQKANTNAEGLRAKQAGVQQQTEQLQQELEQETQGPGGGGTQAPESGEVYFGGTVIIDTRNNAPVDPSTDAFGHGVGMSQWGAYGAAQRGWSASQIVTFYYSNTRVEARPGMTVTVDGYGTMSIEDYVSNLGEVPSKACGTLEQIQQWSNYADQQGWAANDPRRNKYIVSNGNVWACWPEEAIKAQIIAARSYAVTSSQPICTTASCQVYNPNANGAKAWAAWETKDQFIVSSGATHNNQIIRAFYSAYNHNGVGTADNDTIWSNNAGDGTYYSYLRSVNDTGSTYHYTFARSEWRRTNSYSMSDLDQMINWCTQNCNTKDWIKSNVQNRIGSLRSLQLQKDGSGRVKKVILVGSNGQASMSGRYFRSVFNLWVERVQPSGEIDKIPSVSFSMIAVE